MQLVFRNSVVAEMNVCLLTYTEVFQILKNVSYQFTYITYTLMYIVSYIHTYCHIVRALNMGVFFHTKQIPTYQSTVSRWNITRNI